MRVARVADRPSSGQGASSHSCLERQHEPLPFENALGRPRQVRLAELVRAAAERFGVGAAAEYGKARRESSPHEMAVTLPIARPSTPSSRARRSASSILPVSSAATNCRHTPCSSRRGSFATRRADALFHPILPLTLVRERAPVGECAREQGEGACLRSLTLAEPQGL